MGLERVVELVDVQLAVMQPGEAEAAEWIRKKADDDWHILGSQAYDATLLPLKIAALRDRFVVVGKKGGVIVAVYEPPGFGRDFDGGIVMGKGRFKGSLGSIGFEPGNVDYFAVSDERKGIGTAFFHRFQGVLEHLAFAAGCQVAHRIYATHRSEPFFQKVGYTAVFRIQGLRADYVEMEKTCPLVCHDDLPAGEANIVSAMLGIMQKQIGVLPVRQVPVVAQQTI